MYAYLWRSLPGPRAVKVIVLTALIVALILLLLEVVFPWVSARMPYTDVTV